MWNLFFIISLVCLIGSVVLAIVAGKTKYKRHRILSPFMVLFAGVVLSSVVLFIPIYLTVFDKDGSCGGFEAVVVSLHNVIRLFVVDGEFSFVTDNLGGASKAMAQAYSTLFSILFVAAPFLTFGFVLSFFKNIWEHIRYIFHFKSDVFIFSQLNEKSIALTQSLSAKNRKRFFVFTGVEIGEESDDLIERAKEVGAVCFRRDIVTVNLSFHSKRSEMHFFAIGEDESDNVSLALKIVDKFRYRENSNLYVVTNQVESEMILASAYGKDSDKLETKIRVRRVNEVRSLILRNLYENGYEKIFKSAYDDGSGTKKINAVVVGMGQHGADMTKALTWFCQMNGYQVRIDSFDIDEHADEKFHSSCPELMDKNGNVDVEDEAKYTVNIHSNVDVDAVSFDRMIGDLPQTTYVFVSLGSDEQNIAISVKLRTLYERMGFNPEIQAIVYDSSKKNALNGALNFRNQKYRIDFIGDMRTSFSEEVVLSSDIEMMALERHKKWGAERDFWKYDYNYKSSIASAIHCQMKKLCGIPGIDKAPDKRTDEERYAIRVLEHNRWNAYMRSEGYVYGGTIEKSGRNDLAKMHNCLVPFHKLPPSEQEKDDD